jgi:hypothetical protein
MTNWQMLTSSLVFLFSAVPFYSASRGEWPFRVDAEGAASIKLILSESDECEHIPAVTLQHKLFYDGADYTSRLVTVGFDSHLVTHGRGSFKWQLLDGSEIFFLNGRTESRGWKMIKHDSGAISIISSDGRVKYEFENSLLVRLECDKRSFGLCYRKGKVVAVFSLGKPRFNLITVGYDEFMRISDVTTMEANWHYQYDSAARLRSVMRDRSGHFEFVYDRGLLVNASGMGSLSINYHWGRANWHDYLTPINPCPPVVVSDDHFRYAYKMDRRYTRVRFTGKTGNGVWLLSKASGSVQLRYE